MTKIDFENLISLKYGFPTHELNKNKIEFLGELKFYIEKLLFYLWEKPDLIFTILINSDLMDIKNYLAHLFCHDFFQNALSPYTVEENLLYIFSLLLKDEIDKLKSVNDFDMFLNKTKCGYMLSELRKKREVITYSKCVFFNLVEIIENSTYISLNLDINYLEKVIDKLEEEKSLSKNMVFLEDYLFSLDLSGEQKNKELKVNKKNEYLRIFDIEDMEEEIMIFNSKYIPNLDREEFDENIKSTKDQNMLDYLTKYRNIVLKNNKLFFNDIIVDIICKKRHSDLVLTLYQINFLKLIELINSLIDSLINNIKLIPNSIKCISKIIYRLIKNKFPDINTLTLNSFLAQFLFIDLLIPIFRNPFNMFINDFVISAKTLDNLKTLFEIFSQLITGKLFGDNENKIHYKPFNRFFIEKMPKIFEFYNLVIDVQCPTFIEDFINGKLPNDYKYEYFNENKNQIILHNSFCITMNELMVLLNNMINCNNIIKQEKDIYDIFTRLTGPYVKKKVSDFPIEELEKKLFFPYLLKNPKYEYLFQIKQKKPYFFINELESISNEEEAKKNNMIRAKNYISGLLYKCRDLQKSDFSSEKTLDILKDIKLFLKTSEFVLDNSLPYEWYVKSFLECLNHLPQNLVLNDYHLFYEEIKKEINDSLKIFDFNKITECFSKIKYIKNKTEFYHKCKDNINDIILNEKVQTIIEKETYNVEIQCNNESFKIYKPKNNVNPPERLFITVKCHSLNSFIRKFPNLPSIINKRNRALNLDSNKLFKIIKDLSIQKELNTYLEQYTNYVLEKNKHLFTEEESTIIRNKIYDYTFQKLYYKIYPKSPTKKDKIITNNCNRLSWTEPKHFFGNVKMNNYDIFMDDVKQLFDKLDKEKSPRKKILIISEIFKTMVKIKIFNMEQSGVDDILNILVFIFVQVKPKYIYTDIQYIELFINKPSGNIQSQFAIMKTACKFITNIESKKLLGVDEEEFNKKFNANN